MSHLKLIKKDFHLPSCFPWLFCFELHKVLLFSLQGAICAFCKSFAGKYKLGKKVFICNRGIQTLYFSRKTTNAVLSDLQICDLVK